MNKVVGMVVGAVAGSLLWAGAAHANPPSSWVVTIGDLEVTEGLDPTAMVPVTLDQPAPAGDLCLEIMLGTGAGDTATATRDYQSPTIQLVFQPGNTQGAALIPILADKVLEPDETFTVAAIQIACTPGGALLANVDTSDVGVVTIHDGDNTGSDGGGGTLPGTGSGASGMLTLWALALLGVGSLALGTSRRALRTVRS